MKEKSLRVKRGQIFYAYLRHGGILSHLGNQVNARSATVSLFIFILLLLTQVCMAETASWYSVESCKREGTWQKYGGKTASGEVFDDTKMVAASWDYPFQTKLRITNVRNGESVVCRVNDRGPAKRLYRMGRIVDLSRAAFDAIASLERGVIDVRVEEIE